MQVAELFEQAKIYLTDHAPQFITDFLLAILVLIIGFWIAGQVRRFVMSAAKKSNRLDTTLGVFFAGLSKTVVIIITILVVMETFGFKVTSLVAIFGAAGIAIGLALQGTLSNIASGVMLLMFRPFKVGDFIRVSSHEGTVKEISLFTTVIDTPDNIRITIPNNSVWGSSVINLSYHDTRRAQLIFGIGYGEDMEKAMTIIKTVLEEEERCLKDPEPVVAVQGLNDSSVDIMVRFWTQRPDFAATQWAVTQKVKEAFDREDVDIPFPTRTLVQNKS